MPSLEVKTVLEMGLFQMFFMDVPDHAAINTSVELAKSANLGDGAARLVNAVLRSARRTGEPALPPQRVRRVSIENSVPEWIVRRWFDIYGADAAEAIAKSTLERPVEWVRVNTQKSSAPVVAQKIGLHGASILYDRYIELPRDVGVKLLLALPEFVKGEFSFQNPSAFEVVKLLDLKPGLKVWDACAAPGGKSALMAEMDSSLEIFASDSSAARLEKMQDLMNRLGLTNVKTECIDVVASDVDSRSFDSARSASLRMTRAPKIADAATSAPLSSLVCSQPKAGVLSSKFDRILLDVPCSNMGVIARRPESVYRITQESVKELSELQFKILENASKFLAEGGRLVYATCSPDPMETTQVINRFIKAHPEFVKAGDAVLPGKMDPRLDGFFAQALEYKK